MFVYRYYSLDVIYTDIPFVIKCRYFTPFKLKINFLCFASFYTCKRSLQTKMYKSHKNNCRFKYFSLEINSI